MVQSSDSYVPTKNGKKITHLFRQFSINLIFASLFCIKFGNRLELHNEYYFSTTYEWLLHLSLRFPPRCSVRHARQISGTITSCQAIIQRQLDKHRNMIFSVCSGVVVTLLFYLFYLLFISGFLRSAEGEARTVGGGHAARKHRLVFTGRSEETHLTQNVVPT